MRLKFILTFLAVLPFIAIAQDLANTELATQYVQKAEDFGDNGNYDSALYYYEKGIEIYQSNEDHLKHIEQLNKMARMYRLTRNTTQMAKVSQQALGMSEEHFGKVSKIYAESLSMHADVMNQSLGSDSATALQKKAIIMLKQFEGTEHSMAKGLESIGFNFFYISLFDSSVFYMNAGLDILLKLPDADPVTVGGRKLNLGSMYYYKAEYMESLDLFKQAKASFEEAYSSVHPYIAGISQNIGNLYSAVGEYDSALFYLNRSVEIRITLDGENALDLDQSYLGLGSLYSLLFEHEKAIGYYEKALKTFQNSADLEGEAMSLMNIGNSYRQLGELEASKDYLLTALGIREKHISENLAEMASTLGNLGSTYADMQKYDEAIKYIKMAIDRYKEILGPNHPDIIIHERALADAYFSMGQIELAEKLIKKNLEDKISLGISSKVEIASTRASYALTQQELGDFHKAIALYKEAIGTLNENVGLERYFLISIYLDLAVAYKEQGNYEEALNSIQQSLIHNFQNFKALNHIQDPSDEEPIDYKYYLTAMSYKGEIFLRRHLKDGIEEDLVQAKNKFEIADSLLSVTQSKYFRFEDKLRLNELYRENYQGGIHTASLANDLEQIHFFFERSKAALLTENLSASYANKFSGISEPIVSKLEKLKKDKSFYKSSLLNLENSTSGDTSKAPIYQHKLLRINETLDSLQEALAMNYPKYYELKYGRKTAEISEIQSRLSAHQALFEYFDGDSIIHVIVISKDDTKYHRISKDSILQEYMNKFRQSFDPEYLTNNSVDAYQQFVKASFGLYQTLLAPALQELSTEVEQLIIIPDGESALLPWELLIREKPESQDLDYSSLDYLLNDYSISYAYSTNLLFNDRYIPNGKPPGNVLAFAPSYPETSDSVAYLDSRGLKSVFRDALTPLKWNKQEVTSIEENLTGNFYTSDAATESAFKKEAANHRILHLSMHALIDHEDPMLSKLAFSPDQDSLEDGMLHTYELYNMNLSAEMAVLSACETGIGELNRGEGVMSLGRAFAYAGCPTVVMSHWSVDDESTAQVMTVFYKYLEEGKDKATALKLAKLNFLKQAIGPKQHPFYWGGFIVLGNTDPLESDNNMRYWVLLGLLVCGTVLWSVRRKRASS